MIEIRKVQTRKERKAFLDFPLKLYKKCPYFAPPLYLDEKKIFSEDYFYNKTSESVFFLAYRGKEVVGRISGILQKASNEKWNQKRVRFTRFDCIDDKEVAKALFSELEKWAREKGMEEVVGPLGYSDMEREGLLIEGFNELSTFEEQYNYPYYQGLIEAQGYEKDVDWVERKIFAPEEIDPRIELVVKTMMEREGLKLAQFKNTDEMVRRYADQFFDLVDETYQHLYGTVPFIPEQRDDIVKGFKLLLSPDYMRIIVDKEDRVVAFGLCFPSITKALQKSSGHLTLPAIFKLLKAKKHPEILDLGLIGVIEKYRNSGIAWAILLEIMKLLKNGGVQYCETNLNLEDNSNIQNNWDRFENVLHKRRRSFVKRIVEER